MDVPMAYFRDGGAARSPCENDEAYSRVFWTRLSWIGVAMMNGDEMDNKDVCSSYLTRKEAVYMKALKEYVNQCGRKDMERGA